MVNQLLVTLVNSVLGSGKATARNNYAYHCPFCNHHKPKLEVNLTENREGKNPWHCWACDVRGTTINLSSPLPPNLKPYIGVFLVPMDIYSDTNIQPSFYFYQELLNNDLSGVTGGISFSANSTEWQDISISANKFTRNVGYNQQYSSRINAIQFTMRPGSVPQATGEVASINALKAYSDTETLNIDDVQVQLLGSNSNVIPMSNNIVETSAVPPPAYNITYQN